MVHNVNYNEGTSKLVDNVVRKSLDGSKHSIYKKVGFFMIEVGSKAKIVSGKNTGWYIWIQDDTENTGGYLVVQSPSIEFTGNGYDNWFATIDKIEKHFELNKWIVEWLD